ncbi:GTP-binding protein [Actinacidiphila acidipaludis]|uniref:GTP-binding protein n=1 Tax=Actinacidiphila acidipaludis TaxID=2873382 RepID=UPI0027E0D431|nr:ATP/GTP-binding protein [Streptomyces acidipaludis]
MTIGTTEPTSVKILVVGSFGVGKTTAIGGISEIRPLTTEEPITDLSAATDDLSSTPGKKTTTVALDFGRVNLSDDLTLYLFGTPGQERFKELWQDLTRGALGALVLVDPRPDRLKQSFAVLDLVEQYQLPYVIGVNHFDGQRRYPLDEVRDALSVSPATPVVSCDVRRRQSTGEALITLIDHYIDTRL